MGVISFFVAYYILQTIVVPGMIIHEHYYDFPKLKFNDMGFLVTFTFMPFITLPAICVSMIMAGEKSCIPPEYTKKDIGRFGWSFRKCQMHMNPAEVVADEVLRLVWETPDGILEPSKHNVDVLHREIRRRNTMT
jgi:hypothetical protein